MLILLRILITIFLAFSLPQPDLQAQPAAESPSSVVIIDEISVKDMDIVEVLSLISRKSGLNIVAGKNVEGKVTIFLKKVDAREALRTIVEMNDLAFAEEGGIIRVMTAADYLARYNQPFGQPQVTHVIKLQYVPVKDLLPLLSALKSGEGKVISNEEARTVAIMDTAEKVKAMEALIREVDVQTVTSVLSLTHVRAGDICDEVRAMATRSVGMVECDTVGDRLMVTDTLAGVEKIRRAVQALDARGLKILLEVKLVHIVLNEDHLNGVDWAGIVSDIRDIRLEGNYPFLNSGGRGALLSLGVIADEDLEPLVEALDTVGIVKEYPEADITITPDVVAKVILRIDEPFVTLNEASVSEVEEADAKHLPDQLALEFLVKPVVAADGSIQTSVVPHESAQALKGAVRKSRGESLSLEEGNSLVLGSVIASGNVATLRKIPLMGDIPLLGFAFRYHKSSVRREEFIIFLTPKIVQAPVVQAPVEVAASSDLSNEPAPEEALKELAPDEAVKEAIPAEPLIQPAPLMPALDVTVPDGSAPDLPPLQKNDPVAGQK
jgi:type IV pilus assembly protein PilQ